MPYNSLNRSRCSFFPQCFPGRVNIHADNLESYTFSPMIWLTSSGDRPHPLSSTDISTKSFSAGHRILTLTPLGSVLYVHFSANVFIIKRVNALSAFTQASVGSTSKSSCFISKARLPFLNNSKSSFSSKNFDAQTQCTLLHLNPQSQNFIIFRLV